jgi:hypothetical protein
MTMAFRVGQKVVHVADTGNLSRKRGNQLWPAEITVGRVLTIRDIDTRYLKWYGILGLRFEEFVFEAVPVAGLGDVEPAFPSDHFRPLIERKTDTGMAILREILDRESHQDRVPTKAKV